MKFFTLAIFFLTSLVFAQEIDSINNLRAELDLLKSKIGELEKKVSTSDSVQKKEFGLLKRTTLSMFTILRIGELDWNQTAFNVEKGEPEHHHTRFWTRPMFFVFLDSKLSDKFDFRFSFQNYPYSVFGGNSDSRLALVLGELWINYKINKNFSMKFGRQDASSIWDNQIGTQFDFWQHDGLSFKSEHQLKENLKLTTKNTFFIENYINNASFKEQGKLYGMSVKIEKDNPRVSWRLSTGVMKAESLPNTYYSSLGQFFYDGDLAPNYSIFLSQFGITFKELANLSLNVDFYNNFKNYRENPRSNLIRDINGRNYFDEGFDRSTSPDFTKQRTGFFGSIAVNVPFISDNMTVMAGYLYMQKYAALDFFAQYDLARWASTNVKGPEFMIRYKLNDRITFRNRTFFIEEIKGLNGVAPDFVRHGNRTRFDILINF